MQVFLSWSGHESKQLAGIFKEWLPNVLQYVNPYMSSNDIYLGERWNNNITDNLHKSVFGLVFVTPSNINAPWINFEAGALSKTLDSKIIPVLYNSDVMILNDGPLKQFQSTTDLERESIFNLICSINNSYEVGKLEKERIEKSFEMWWPELAKMISEIEADISNVVSEKEGPSEQELLRVIYHKLNEQEKILSHSNFINKKIRNNNFVPPRLLKDLDDAYESLKLCKIRLEGGPYEDDFFDNLDRSLGGLRKAINYLGKEGKLKQESLFEFKDSTIR